MIPSFTSPPPTPALSRQLKSLELKDRTTAPVQKSGLVTAIESHDNVELSEVGEDVEEEGQGSPKSAALGAALSDSFHSAASKASSKERYDTQDDRTGHEDDSKRAEWLEDIVVSKCAEDDGEAAEGDLTDDDLLAEEYSDEEESEYPYDTSLLENLPNFHKLSDTARYYAFLLYHANMFFNKAKYQRSFNTARHLYLQPDLSRYNRISVLELLANLLPSNTAAFM
jgi:hypothetical protein